MAWNTGVCHNAVTLLAASFKPIFLFYLQLVSAVITHKKSNEHNREHRQLAAGLGFWPA